ncbi:oxysterol-binding protein 1-like [Saccoglossus kowalevskii]|uniref:Oxysterol-binding protein n=1 Tax=Saccoglossus kowalevskii TaxID=10224 RepID=A0ABM0GQM4_SACKO|nr:PREDICTED: oxysterol-binding protein 1-like [Saccoglossus kowalevskii]
MADAKNSNPDNFKGWLYKWTNYIKGYQRRWFVLSNGLLSYYRTQAEMAHTCRGTINLAGAYIDTEDTCNFVISSGAQTFHLKASSEVERQRWVTALELAKAKAIRMMEAASDDEDEAAPTEPDKNDIQNTLRMLSSKLEDLTTCNDLIAKHGAALQRSLSELELIQDPAEASTKIKAVNERATLFRITSNAMINACADYLDLAQTQGRKWQRALQYEREQRLRLEETVETLAKQHNTLERACRGNLGPDKGKSKGSATEEFSDDDNEFFDAIEESPSFTTTVQIPTHIKGHRRTDSGASITSIASSEGAGPKYDEDLSSSDDEMSTGRQNQGSVITIKTQGPLPRSGSEVSVNFNEPISMLQRLTEDFEYSDILDKAAQCDDSCEQLVYVAAFTVSSYANTTHRTGKPFNPLLGETYECDRTDDWGWRSLAEQVSHHPPAAALHCESKEWECWQEFTMTSKFRGKYLLIIPQGIAHLRFKKSGNHYTWRKVTTTVHNIIVGKLWVDQSGDMDIFNHKTKDNCHLKYAAYSYFSRDIPRKVTGIVTDAAGTAKYVISGTWDKKMEAAKILHGGERPSSGSKEKQVYQTGPPRLLWHRNYPPPGTDLTYGMTEMACSLNEPEEDVAPSDSRLRPDQRLMEEGLWNEANQVKVQLEEKQRARRRKRESEGKPVETHKAVWFEKKQDPLTKSLIHVFNGQYFEAKKTQDWGKCPDIFTI